MKEDLSDVTGHFASSALGTDHSCTVSGACRLEIGCFVTDTITLLHIHILACDTPSDLDTRPRDWAQVLRKTF